VRHETSSRRSGAPANGETLGLLYAVCGEFRANPQLAQSALFGHAKGAFTGADKPHEGLIARARGDTLFLDEIGDLDRGTQRLLMVAFEKGEFSPLGGAPEQSDFRLITATNKPIDELVGGCLDPDFLDRIATFVLRLPPLRERREDLPLLWRSTLRRVGARVPRGAQVDQLADNHAVLDQLALAPLPGNLRDLHRAAWRGAAALVAGDSLAVAEREAVAALDEDALGASALRLPIDLPAHLGQEKARWLEAAMAAAGHNRTRAAELVRLERKTFGNWLAASRKPTADDA